MKRILFFNESEALNAFRKDNPNEEPRKGAADVGNADFDFDDNFPYESVSGETSCYRNGRGDVYAYWQTDEE